MRLIDADALMEKLKDFCDWCKDGRKQGADFCLDCMIPNAPTIEIVRCKECKHWSDAYICWRRRTQPMAMNPDDFCSYGERESE